MWGCGPEPTGAMAEDEAPTATPVDTWDAPDFGSTLNVREDGTFTLDLDGQVSEGEWDGAHGQGHIALTAPTGRVEGRWYGPELTLTFPDAPLDWQEVAFQRMRE